MPNTQMAAIYDSNLRIFAHFRAAAKIQGESARNFREIREMSDAD